MPITYIDSENITNKRVLVRADFDVSLNPDHTIANDARIKQNIPTLQYLLERNNRVICIAKLGRPKERDSVYSLSIVVKRLLELLPAKFTVRLINDFQKEPKQTFENQKPNELLVLENIRFYKEEKDNNFEFAQQLASFGDVYVNDAFSMCHRKEASIVGIPTLLPSFGGLSLKKEVETIGNALEYPKKPFVVIMGGAKIDTKIGVLDKLITLADVLLVGGGLANMFFKANGYAIGSSLVDDMQLHHARSLLDKLQEKNTQLLLPIDVVLGSFSDTLVPIETVNPKDITNEEKRAILDIGSHTIAQWNDTIRLAQTIVWNGPLGYVEKKPFDKGTQIIFEAIAQNKSAISIIGGGDTISAVSNQKHVSAITHVSTGGGAMLEFIEYGTLPGLEALKRSELSE